MKKIISLLLGILLIPCLAMEKMVYAEDNWQRLNATCSRLGMVRKILEKKMKEFCKGTLPATCLDREIEETARDILGKHYIQQLSLDIVEQGIVPPIDISTVDQEMTIALCFVGAQNAFNLEKRCKNSEVSLIQDIEYELNLLESAFALLLEGK